MSLRIYGDVVLALAALRPIVEQIEARDGDLGEQLRSALSSVALNTSEGGGSQKGNVRARYFNALGSIKESRACLDVATAWAYIQPVDAALADRLDKITAVLCAGSEKSSRFDSGKSCRSPVKPGASSKDRKDA